MTTFRLYAAAAVATLVSLPISAAAQDLDGAQDRDPAAFQFSLWDSAQVIDANRSIHGLRLTLPYGRNWDVYGVDIGIVNRTDNDLEGLQLSVAGFVEGDMKGLQYNALISSVDGSMQGAQMSLINTAGVFEGAQFGAINYARDGATGVGLGFVNVYEGPTVGAALGIVNYARRVDGVQIGLVNVTDHLHGVQIGLVNVARNGFLPVFVILNAAL